MSFGRQRSGNSLELAFVRAVECGLVVGVAADGVRENLMCNWPTRGMLCSPDDATESFFEKKAEFRQFCMLRLCRFSLQLSLYCTYTHIVFLRQ